MAGLDANPEREQRIFEKFVSPEPNTGCWLWTGALLRAGYGNITINKRNYSAHRAMWQLRNGPMPEGKLACHSCDTPGCVNPDHIWPGDYRQNAIDMRTKGRWKVKDPTIPRARRATIADVERAIMDVSVPRHVAERLIRRVYRYSRRGAVEQKLAYLQEYRSNEGCSHE